jgi:hypothetical protein
VAEDVARAEVVAVAMKYLDTNEDELVLLVDRAWRSAGLPIAPTRGAGEYWLSVVKDLIKDIRAQSETTVVTVGFATDKAIEWAAMHGMSGIEPYAIPLGVLAALATKRILAGQGRDESRQHDEQDD